MKMKRIIINSRRNNMPLNLLLLVVLLSANCWTLDAIAADEIINDNGVFEAAFQGKCGTNSPCVQLCVELHDGTFECQCRSGYTLLLDGYSCVETTNTTFSSEEDEEKWLQSIAESRRRRNRYEYNHNGGEDEGSGGGGGGGQSPAEKLQQQPNPTSRKTRINFIPIPAAANSNSRNSKVTSSELPNFGNKFPFNSKSNIIQRSRNSQIEVTPNYTSSVSVSSSSFSQSNDDEMRKRNKFYHSFTNNIETSTTGSSSSSSSSSISEGQEDDFPSAQSSNSSSRITSADIQTNSNNNNNGLLVLKNVSSSSSSVTDNCPLQCNTGICSKEYASSWPSSSSSSSSSDLNVAELLEQRFTGYRCLCPMGYHGSNCEIEDSSADSGYSSGLFRGQSWVAFPVLHDAYMSDQISIEFRPEFPNGILLLTGERNDLSGDFLALFLRDGYLEFRFDCGSGTGVVKSSTPVKLQEFNRANIIRRRWDGWMQLNDGPFVQGRSKGLFSRITFRQPVFIGGAGNISFTGASTTLPDNDDESESKGNEGGGVVIDWENKSSSSRTGGGNSTQQQQSSEIDSSASTLPILRKTPGFQGCIRNLIINDRTYRFGLEPAGDSLQGFDIENCNDKRVCDLLTCQHGGQCVVQKVDTPVCMCFIGFTGRLCETPLYLQIPSFNGSSYLKYGGLGFSRALSWLELEVVMKPDALDGLILYNGYKTDGVGDFIALSIDQGYLEFAMDLGTGTAILRSENTVALEEWHRVKISRTSRLISMKIDNQLPVMALTPGAFTQLTLPHNLFLGGIPEPQWLSPKVKVHGGFSGCIQKLVINDKSVRIMGSAISGVNVENCAHPCLTNPCGSGGECVPELDTFSCHCQLGFRDSFCQTRMDKEDTLTPPKFIGDSYLKFTSSKIIRKVSGPRLDLSFKVKTTLSRGLILWAGRHSMTSTSDFLSIGLRNGFIHSSFSLGSGQTFISYNKTKIDDGEWHRIRLIRNEQEASLSVDDLPPTVGVTPGKLRQLNINDGLYIGGLEDARHQSMNKYSEGFVGCLTDLILDDEYRVALLQDASEGRNLDYCD